MDKEKLLEELKTDDNIEGAIKLAFIMVGYEQAIEEINKQTNKGDNQ